MPISPGPVVPNIVERPATFEAEAEAYTDWLAGEHRTQLNALEVNVNAKEALAASSASSAVGSASAAAVSAAATAASAAASAASASSALAAPNTSATSSTSITPGPGAVNFVTQAGKAFAAGQALSIVSAADPRQWMVGTVSSYAGTALAVNVTAYGQSPSGGAAVDWVISFWGALPPAAKPGQVLRLRGATPEWGDEGGEAVQILTAENLALDSADIGGAAWYWSAVVSSDVLVSSDGTRSGATLQGSRAQGVGGALATGIYTFSAEFIAAAPGARAALRFFNGTGDAYWELYVDLSSGAVLSWDVSPGTLRLSDATFSVTPQAGGWWRLSISAPVTNATYLAVASDVAAVGVTRIQLRRGNHPGLYVPTSVAAASGAGSRCRNELRHSLSCDTNELSWVSGDMTRIGRTPSPIGDMTATVYQYDTFSGYVGQLVSGLTPGSRYTASVWYRLISGVPSNGTASMTLYTQGVDISVVVSNLPIVSTWRRASIVATVSDSGDLFFLLPHYVAPGARIAFWFAQLEPGHAPSHPIPTGASAFDGQHADLQLRRAHHIDTTHAPVIVAPPADMAPGDWFDVVDVGRAAATNNITVLRGPHRAIDGDASNFEIDVNGWSGRFTFDAEKGLVIS